MNNASMAERVCFMQHYAAEVDSDGSCHAAQDDRDCRVCQGRTVGSACASSGALTSPSSCPPKWALTSARPGADGGYAAPAKLRAFRHQPGSLITIQAPTPSAAARRTKWRAVTVSHSLMSRSPTPGLSQCGQSVTSGHAQLTCLHPYRAMMRCARQRPAHGNSAEARQHEPLCT